ALSAPCGRDVAESARFQLPSAGRIGSEGGGRPPHPGWGRGRRFRCCGCPRFGGGRLLMAVHEVTFPVTDPAEILKLRAGDEVVVQGHIIGIRDRTQIRIFDQGVEPPMDLTGAFLLHTAPNVRKLGPGRYEKLCIGTTTSARMVRFTEPL